MEYQRYCPDRKLTRVEQYTERAVQLKPITINAPDEEQIVTILAEQFGQTTIDTCKIQGITSILAMERLAERRLLLPFFVREAVERNCQLKIRNYPYSKPTNNLVKPYPNQANPKSIENKTINPVQEIITTTNADLTITIIITELCFDMTEFIIHITLSVI